MRYLGGLILVLILLIWSCSSKISKVFIQNRSSLDSLGILSVRSNDEIYNPCDNPANYAPDTNRLYLIPERSIRLVFHIMNSVDSSKNFSIDQAPSFFWVVMDGAQKILKKNIKMNLPLGNQTPILPARIQYHKYNKLPEDVDQDGFLHHYDDSLYYFINQGKNRNNYSKNVINKYRVGGDTILNVFVMPHHPDSVASPTYRVNSTGIALGNSIKISGIYETGRKPWRFQTLFNHEVGHVMGLKHSWTSYDGCQDTPPHPNCWESNSAPPCQGIQSNNMMDYNNSQRAMTPCQIGIMQRNMARDQSLQRKLLLKNWCELDTSFNILITEKEEWLGARDLRNSIVIKNGGSLTLCCRVSFPKNAKITIEPEAELILKGARLHNDCGQTWQGIEVIQHGDIKGSIIYETGTKIEDVLAN